MGASGSVAKKKPRASDDATGVSCPVGDVCCLTQVTCSVLQKNICLVRAKSGSDTFTTKRWFGYYGNPDPVKFCASKKFVAQYGSRLQGDTYEYVKSMKTIPLMEFPYISIGEATQEQYTLAFRLYEALTKRGENSPEVLQKIAREASRIVKIPAPEDTQILEKLGNEILRTSLWEVLVENNLDSYAYLTESDAKLYNNLKQSFARKPVFSSENAKFRSFGNPDYPVAELVCDLGFHGWIRVATKGGYFPVDEVMFCNYQNLVDSGFLRYDPQCEISSCKTN